MLKTFLDIYFFACVSPAWLRHGSCVLNGVFTFSAQKACIAQVHRFKPSSIFLAYLGHRFRLTSRSLFIRPPLFFFGRNTSQRHCMQDHLLIIPYMLSKLQSCPSVRTFARDFTQRPSCPGHLQRYISVVTAASEHELNGNMALWQNFLLLHRHLLPWQATPSPNRCNLVVLI